MGRIEEWVRVGNQLQRRGRTPRSFLSDAPLEAYQRGVTLVTPDLVGPRAGALAIDRDPDEPLIPYTGPSAGQRLVVSGNGEEFNFIDFGTTRIAFTGVGQKMYGCRQVNTRTDYTGVMAAIECNSGTQQGAVIEYGHIENVVSSYRIANGIQGHDFTLSRSFVEGFIDDVGIWNSTLANKADPVNVKIWDNYLGPLAYYWAATTGVVHPSDNDTHNDVIQIHNGSNIEILGNTLRAELSQTIGDVAKIPSGEWSTSLAAVMLTFAVGTAHGLKVNDNAIFGGFVPFNFGINPATGYTNFGEMLRNRFDSTHSSSQAPVFLDALWQGAFGIGNADVNAYMNINLPNYPRNVANPVVVRRNV